MSRWCEATIGTAALTLFMYRVACFVHSCMHGGEVCSLPRIGILQS